MTILMLVFAFFICAILLAMKVNLFVTILIGLAIVGVGAYIEIKYDDGGQYF